jgi:1-deoxy-D-xylulose-5-phosphate synthase
VGRRSSGLSAQGLTGRRDKLRTIKLKERPRRRFRRAARANTDTFGVGHSSTSISAALGMAIGRLRAASRSVASWQSSAMARSAPGMAFEALNHAGSMDVDMLVILNDNDMSISENVGAFSNYFARVLSARCTRRCARAARKY